MNTFNDPLSSYLNNYKHDAIEIGFHKAKAQQGACFRAIDNKCSLLQDSISYLQKTIIQLQARIRQYGENSQSIKLTQLKDKQKQFIISELQKKVKRLQTNQQNLQAAGMQKQIQISELKQKNSELSSQNAQIKQQLGKKVKQVKQLIKANSTLKLARSFNDQKQAIPPMYTPNISELGIKKQQMFNRNQYYEQLESKLKEMEDCLNGQIQQYKAKNVKLEQEIKRLHQELQKQSINIKRIYQLQLRVKNLSNENRSLEQSYTAQLSTTNQNEVKFHKKINELKNQIQQAKKIQKNAFKQYEKQIRKFSSNILGANDKATIFIGMMTIGDQLSELEKQILKWHRKQIKTVTFEKDAIIQELNLIIQDYKNKISEQNCTIQKMKVKKTQILEKSPIMNGHSIANKSNSQNNCETKEKQKISQRVIQEKYEQKIKEINDQLNERQKIINEMRKKYDESQTEMNKKLLYLEAKITEKQMELQYQEQKMTQLRNNCADMQKTLKSESQKEIKKVKDKIRQVQSLRDEFKNKYKQSQEKLYNKQRSIKEIQKRQREANQKAKKIQKKYQANKQELKKIHQSKDKNIEQLINKNQTLGMELKLSREKLRMTELNLSSFKTKSQSEKTSQQKQINIREIQNQFLIQKQHLEMQITMRQNDIQALKQKYQQKAEVIKKKQQKIIELSQQINKIDNDLKLLRNQNQLLRQSSEKIKQLSEKNNNFTQLRQEYEKREKLLKAQGEKVITQIKNSKKEVQAQNKKLLEQINQLKTYNSQIKGQFSQIQQQKLKFNAEKFKDSQKERKMVKGYQQKISQLNKKISQLQDKFNTTLQNSPIKSPISGIKSINQKKFKGTDSTQYTQYGIMTDKISKNDQGINTIDLFALQIQNNGAMNKILDLNDEPQGEVSRNSNLFLNLKGSAPVNDDFFEICDQNQVVNFGESQFKLQIREIFTNLRIQIEKLFNLDEISFATTKLLPKGLQDDYYQLMGYIKQKIIEIRQQNQISFIMAERGDEPEPNIDNSLQLPGLIQRYASQGIPNESLRKVIQQKEALINSLMNERTSQQNTINQLTVQKQEIQQQNQNRFMNQCNVYKKQIKQHKKTIDKFEMNMQSMRIIIRNVLQAYSDNEDMEDDFRESMNLYAKVSNLNQKQRSRINYYIQRYLEIKGLDAS